MALLKKFVGLLALFALECPLTSGYRIPHHGSSYIIPRPNAAYRNLTSDPVGVGHAVTNLETTVQFYSELLGLVVISHDRDWRCDAAYGMLTDTAGAEYKQAVIAIPNQN